MPVTGTRAELPLEDRLAMVLALKKKLTAAQLAELGAAAATAEVTPAAGCTHGPHEGRCQDCKREADKRYYARKKAQRAAAEDPVIALLVSRGLAVREDDGSLAYKGPVIAPPRKPPALPMDLPPALEDHLRRAGIEFPRTRAEVPLSERACQDAESRASRGTRARGHQACGYCDAVTAVAREAHTERDPLTNRVPADLARDGRRAEYHDDCRICAEIQDQANRERMEFRAGERAAGRPGRTAEGRDIRSDGSLCWCQDCDVRVSVRAGQVRAEAVRARLTDTPIMHYWSAGTATTAVPLTWASQ
jgi:hypothetical protein